MVFSLFLRVKVLPSQVCTRLRGRGWSPWRRWSLAWDSPSVFWSSPSWGFLLRFSRNEAPRSPRRCLSCIGAPFLELKILRMVGFRLRPLQSQCCFEVVLGLRLRWFVSHVFPSLAAPRGQTLEWFWLLSGFVEEDESRRTLLKETNSGLLHCWCRHERITDVFLRPYVPRLTGCFSSGLFSPVLPLFHQVELCLLSSVHTRPPQLIVCNHGNFFFSPDFHVLAWIETIDPQTRICTMKNNYNKIECGLLTLNKRINTELTDARLGGLGRNRLLTPEMERVFHLQLFCGGDQRWTITFQLHQRATFPHICN